MLPNTSLGRSNVFPFSPSSALLPTETSAAELGQLKLRFWTEFGLCSTADTGLTLAQLAPSAVFNLQLKGARPQNSGSHTAHSPQVKP